MPMLPDLDADCVLADALALAGGHPDILAQIGRETVEKGAQDSACVGVVSATLLGTGSGFMGNARGLARTRSGVPSSRHR